MAILIPAGGFTQQLEEFAKQLAYLSDVVDVGDDRGAQLRSTSFRVELPDPSSGASTIFDYREEFRRTQGGWLRTRYHFELRVSQPNERNRLHSRKAHHEHEDWGIHQHCESPGRPGAHYVDVERLKQATHEDFLRFVAKGSPIECSGLVRLGTPRDQRNRGAG